MRQKSLFNNDSRNQKIIIHFRIIKKREQHKKSMEPMKQKSTIKWSTTAALKKLHRIIIWLEIKTYQYYEGPMSIKNWIKKKGKLKTIDAYLWPEKILDFLKPEEY